MAETLFTYLRRLIRRTYYWYFKKDYILEQKKRQITNCKNIKNCYGCYSSWFTRHFCKYLNKKTGHCMIGKEIKNVELPLICKLLPFDVDDLLEECKRCGNLRWRK